MYCILVTGIPAAGKSYMAEKISNWFDLPMISKDSMKEKLFDTIGFQSRQEKMQLNQASTEIMYYCSEQLMKHNQPFLLENNFENASKDTLFQLLSTYSYQAITVVLTGDYQCIYERFVKRDQSSARHRGHVVNDCYPEQIKNHDIIPITYEAFVSKIKERGMDTFQGNGPKIIIDTTDVTKIDEEKIKLQIKAYMEQARKG